MIYGGAPPGERHVSCLDPFQRNACPGEGIGVGRAYKHPHRIARIVSKCNTLTGHQLRVPLVSQLQEDLLTTRVGLARHHPD